MYQRKESNKKVVLLDGTTLNVRVLDGITIEDVMGQHMDAFLFGLVSGNYKPAKIGRDVKDYLIRLYTIT